MNKSRHVAALFLVVVFAMTLGGTTAGSGWKKADGIKSFQSKFDTGQSDPKPAMKSPKIESALAVPSGPYKEGSSLGVLRPGFKLILEGRGFGTQPGKIMMSGAGGFVVDLNDVSWESNVKVTGVVPISTNGKPNQPVKIRVVSKKVQKDMFDVSNVSNPWNMRFEGRDEKVLTSGAVAMAHCGKDGNYNQCNDYWVRAPEYDRFHTELCPTDYAVCGFHENAWGAVGDDRGKDVFVVNLKNDWVLKSVQKFRWEGTSDNEVLSGPSGPCG